MEYDQSHEVVGCNLEQCCVVSVYCRALLLQLACSPGRPRISKPFANCLDTFAPSSINMSKRHFQNEYRILVPYLAYLTASSVSCGSVENNQKVVGCAVVNTRASLPHIQPTAAPMSRWKRCVSMCLCFLSRVSTPSDFLTLCTILIQLTCS